MKRINYDGQSLVTGTDVANALTEYAQAAARMSTSTAVEIPVLEENGTVAVHALLLTSATSLESFDIDGHHEDEAERFPVPTFPPVGGKAVPISTAEIAGISLPMAD